MLTLLLIFSPIVAIFSFAALSEEAFSESFVGILDEKFERLTATEGEKIVVVGGSSVAFGLDSAALERYTGMPVVNFGLYAALGTRLMLDLSLAGIGEGDIVVVAPEINPETLSLYFNADTTWRAIDGNLEMLKYVSADNMPAMAGALFSYAGDKLAYLRADAPAEDGEGVYFSRYFNEYCDFALPREENVMSAYYDPNTPIPLDVDAYGSELDEFIDYLNAYVKKCRRAGAEVYFTFPPMNELALTEASRTDARYDFADMLAEELACEVISSPDDYIMEAGYFFDTNFHLGNAGAAVRTIRLARDIRLAAGISAGVITDSEPEAPKLPGIDAVYNGTDENDIYFTYTLRENGTYAITGISELGRNMSELTVPLGYNGKKVTAISARAFSYSRLERLIITSDSNLNLIENGAFIGASNLTHLYIYKPSGDYITPPASFAGTHSSFVVHVPKGSDYKTHYYWGERGLDFVFDAEIED